MKPYHYSIEYRELTETYYDKFHKKRDLGERVEFIDRMVANMKQYGFYKYRTEKDELAVDDIIGKQIMNCLHDFFGEQKETRKQKIKIKTKNNSSNKHTRKNK